MFYISFPGDERHLMMKSADPDADIPAYEPNDRSQTSNAAGIRRNNLPENVTDVQRVAVNAASSAPSVRNSSSTASLPDRTAQPAKSPSVESQELPTNPSVTRPKTSPAQGDLYQNIADVQSANVLERLVGEYNPTI